MTSVIRFIEDGDESLLDTDIPARLSGICSAMQKRMAECLVRTRKENVRLVRKMNSLSRVEQARIDEEGYPELGLDSVDVARAALYFLKAKGAYTDMLKLMQVVYIIYCDWLAARKERLFLDHPQAIEEGPWFWRVKNRIPKVGAVPVSELKKSADAVFERNSGAGVLVRNVCNKYHDISGTTLQSYLRKSEPYRKASKEHNNGRWNKVIEDADIVSWKSLGQT